MKTINEMFKHDNFKEIFENEYIENILQNVCNDELIRKRVVSCSRDIYCLAWKSRIDKIVYQYNLLCTNLSSYKTLTLNKKREYGIEDINFVANYNNTTDELSLEYTGISFINAFYQIEGFRKWENYLKYYKALSSFDIRKSDYFCKQILYSYLYIDNFCTSDNERFLVEIKEDEKVDVKFTTKESLTELYNEHKLPLKDELIRKLILKQ